ncbi:MAG: hypothetical protein GY816_02360, partial [Cytophagales bacterium]|nr:hypothetical protein [Cytophagales bacterium]
MKIKFTPEDLKQITPERLEKMRKCDLISLLLRMRNFGIDLYERLNTDSSSSSKPPSSDSPYRKPALDETEDSVESDPQIQDESDQDNVDQGDVNELVDDENEKNHTDKTEYDDDGPKRNPGRQPGSQGYGRKHKPKPDKIKHHYPEQCIICLKELDEPARPYMAHYTYELERK